MDQTKIKDLMIAMEEHGINKLHLKEGDEEVMLEKTLPPVISHSIPHITPETSYVVKNAVTSNCSDSSEGGPCEYIKSPMVGTFYEAPSPEAPSFVKIGDYVTEDSVVCIIEAMKVMNEIKAGVNGKIESVLVEAGHPVEFGTKLFKVV